MKRTLLLTVCATALSISASQTMAADAGPGCGLGQMAFEGSSGVLAHTSAGTTNGSTFNQAFALSTGTLGCDTSQQVRLSDDKEVFVATNMDSLSQEIAQGQGDHLTTLASIFGVSEKDQSTFTASLQDKYSTVFSSNTTSTTDVIAAIDDLMQNNPNLAKYTR